MRRFLAKVFLMCDVKLVVHEDVRRVDEDCARVIIRKRSKVRDKREIFDF